VRALDDLGVTLPVLAAPMAGRPSTAALVVAAAQAGSLGFVPAGYLPAEAFAAQLAAVRSSTPVFGVNLFAPNPLAVEPVEFRRYAEALQPEADVYGLELRGVQPTEDDDDWQAKIDVLLADPVPLASFTFGVPGADVVQALRRAGTVVLQTVTSPAEALIAAAAGVDALIVQASAAGGHSGTLTPRVLPPEVPLVDLVGAVRAVVPLPVVAGGGVGTAADVEAVLSAGASAVAVGTALLRTAEAGTSAPYRAALSDPSRAATVVTRAFTGRPARGLRNGFTDRHTAGAPSGYPALHHLTRPIRRAAAEAGDPERINLWAGTGFREAREESVASTLTRLAGGTS
jgi:NAD(P)H-dependent flavin oxidoreductase YrpB (nitropropane dioxygenase family)